MKNFSKWGTFVSCSLACFLAWLDFSVMNVAIPAIQKDLNASFLQMQWMLNAYIIAFAVLNVIFGRFSDYFGRLKMLLIGIMAFGIFSLTAGFAPNPHILILSRFMLGVACAAIVPTSMALLSHAFPGEEKGKALGLWGGITGLAMAIGPALGGFLISALNWRWIFFINIPICAIAMAAAIYYIVDLRRDEKSMPPDLKGAALLTLALFSLVFSLMHGPDWGWLSALTLVTFASSILLFILFVFAEKKSRSPILPPAIFKSRGFLCGCFAMIGLIFVFNSNLFLIPLYLVDVRGQEAYQAGLSILTISLGIAIVSPLSGKWTTMRSTNRLILMGMLLYLASPLLQLSIQPQSSLAWILFTYIFLGIGWGITRSPATTLAISSAPHEFAGTVSGVLWTIQNIFGSISIAIVLTIFRTISGQNYTADSFMAGYRTSLWILLGTILAMIFLFIFLRKPKIKI